MLALNRYLARQEVGPHAAIVKLELRKKLIVVVECTFVNLFG